MYKIVKIAVALILILVKYCVSNHDLLAKFHQHDYDIKNFRVELESYDRDFYKICKIVTFKYNRSTAAINASFNLNYDVEDKLEFLVQVYKKASNEYRRFPIRMLLNVNEMFEMNAAGLRYVTKCGNIKKVYFLKNVDYLICNFVPDKYKLPPLIPIGEFQIQIHTMFHKQEITIFNVFGEVYRHIKVPK